MFRRSISVFLIALTTLTGCSHYGAARPESADSSAARSAGQSAEYEASLGTAWGERIESRLNYVNFERDEPHHPETIASIYYDDEYGIRKLSGLSRDRARPFTIAQGDYELGLTDEESGVFWSPFLPGLERNGKYYVRGNRGDRYAIYFRNRSDRRVEVVLSVDGVDVMNGQPASFEHRGYIVEPGEKLEVEGFRDSRNSVAAFRFSTPEQSYASEKHGTTQNVGVIGLAIFAERGDPRFAYRPRGGSRANPFPGEFATAP